MGCPALRQGIFLTQGLNIGLQHCRRILYHLSHQGSPRPSGTRLIRTAVTWLIWAVSELEDALQGQSLGGGWRLLVCQAQRRVGEATRLPAIGPQLPTQAPTLSAREGLPGAMELEGAVLNPAPRRTGGALAGAESQRSLVPVAGSLGLVQRPASSGSAPLPGLLGQPLLLSGLGSRPGAGGWSSPPRAE